MQQLLSSDGPFLKPNLPLSLPFFSVDCRPVFLSQCRLTAHFFELRVNRTQTKTSLFILLDSKCSLSHCCSIESWFFHIAKKLGLEKFITATQTTIAKNDIGFPTANSSPSFRLMRKLAIQDGLNPLTHGAERCTVIGIGVSGSKKWKEIPKRNFVLPAQRK